MVTELSPRDPKAGGSSKLGRGVQANSITWKEHLVNLTAPVVEAAAQTRVTHRVPGESQWLLQGKTAGSRGHSSDLKITQCLISQKACIALGRLNPN